MKHRMLLLVRWGVFLAAAAFLWVKLAGDQGTHAAWGALHTALASAPAWFWPLMLAMAGLNWGLEAIKWKRLVAEVEVMSLGRALTATLAGTAVALVTPNRTGEVAGRVLFLAPDRRWRGGVATVLGAMAQFTATLLLGAIAFLWWHAASGLPAAVPPGWGPGPVVAALLLACASLGLYLRPRLVHRGVARLPLLRRLAGPAEVLHRFRTPDLMAVLGLSIARYAVFWLQYVVFLVVLAGMAWQGALVAVPVIYLVSTLVPTMLLSELGVRGSVAVALLLPLGGAPALVLLASFGVWALNLALPAAAGAVVMVTSRMRNRR